MRKRKVGGEMLMFPLYTKVGSRAVLAFTLVDGGFVAGSARVR